MKKKIVETNEFKDNFNISKMKSKTNYTHKVKSKQKETTEQHSL